MPPSFTGFSLKVMTLPEHILYYYTLPVDIPLASGLQLDINLLSIRLTGKFLAVLDDPEEVIPKGERVFELAAPCVGRGGHPKVKTTITATSDGSTAMCLYPKDEIHKIVGDRKAAELLALPPYTLIKEITR